MASAAATGALGAYAEATFPLNDAYNAGNSPAGYQKYMAFYSKCFVIGARIQIRFAVIDNATTNALFVGLAVTTNSNSLVSNVRMIENGMVDWTVVFNLPDRVTLNQAVSVGRFLNKPKVLDDPQLFSTAAASPVQLVVAHLAFQSVAAASTAINGGYIAEIEYDCVFTDPVPFT